MGKKLPILYNALLLTGVNLLLRFVATSFQVHISARIGAAGGGLLQLVMSVGSLALTLGMAGVRTATMYLTAEELGKQRPQNVHWVLRGCGIYSLLFSLGAAAILYGSAPLLATHWIGIADTVPAIRCFACFLPLTCLSGMMVGYFTAANRIGTLAAVEVGEQACYMAVTMSILLLWAGSDPHKACVAVILGSGISTMLTLGCLVLLRRKEKASVGAPIPVGKRLRQAALPLALGDVTKAGINTTENLMVPKRLALYPAETAPLATFGMVCGMVFPILMFPAAILFSLAELLIPELARCNAAGSRQRIRYLVRRGLQAAMLYGCLCGGLMYLLAEGLCLRIYQSREAGAQLARYSLLVPMLYCDAITDAMVKGLGQQKYSVRYNICTSAMDVAGLFLLLPRYGMDGYFISFALTHLVNFLLSLGRLLKISKIRIPFYAPAFAISGTLAAVAGASCFQNAGSRTAAYLGLLCGLWVIFRVVTRRDLRWILGLVFPVKERSAAL